MTDRTESKPATLGAPLLRISDALFTEADHLEDYGNEASVLTQSYLVVSVKRLREHATRLRRLADDCTTPTQPRDEDELMDLIESYKTNDTSQSVIRKAIAALIRAAGAPAAPSVVAREVSEEDVWKALNVWNGQPNQPPSYWRNSDAARRMRKALESFASRVASSGSAPTPTTTRARLHVVESIVLGLDAATKELLIERLGAGAPSEGVTDAPEENPALQCGHVRVGGPCVRRAGHVGHHWYDEPKPEAISRFGVPTPEEYREQRRTPPTGHGAPNDEGVKCIRCGRWHTGLTHSDEPTALCEVCVEEDA